MLGNTHSRRCATAAAAWLVLGWVLYVVTRPPEIPLIPDLLSLSHMLPLWLEQLSGPLPSFVHAIAMCLLIVAVLPPDRRSVTAACGVWAVIAVAIEWLQHPGFNSWVSGQFAGDATALSRFGAGSFDPLDVAAALTGALYAHTSVHTWLGAHYIAKEEK